MAEARPERPGCAAFVAASLDGFIARPDGNLDWLGAVQVPGEDYGFAAFLASTDVLVLGRKTYDAVLRLGAWPYEGKRCIVLTHRALSQRHGEERFEGSPEGLVERLGREDARRLYVDGGDVVRQFLGASLLDELVLSVVPVVLGAGVRLLSANGPERRLALEACRSWPSGLVQMRYR